MKQDKDMIRRRKKWERKDSKYGWFFVSPFVIGLLLIYIPVLIDSIKISFSEVNITSSGYSLDFVKLENFKYALKVDPDFLRLLVSTFGDFIVHTFVIIFFSLFIAVILNQNFKGRGFFRAVFLLPVVLATGIVAKAEISNTVMSGYQSMAGAASTGAATDTVGLATMLNNLYISTSITDFITGLISDIYDIVNYSGVQIILFLGGLQGINPSVYEAAKIEGATGWESFWKLTLPIMSPIIFVNVVYTAVDIFTRSDNEVINLISTTMLGKMNYGASSAMAWIYFLLIAIVLGGIALIYGKYFAEKE